MLLGRGAARKGQPTGGDAGGAGATPLGGEAVNAEVHFDWTADRTMSVETSPSGLVITAHPGLSTAEVEIACAELGDHGPAVLAAWRSAVGLTDSPLAR